MQAKNYQRRGNQISLGRRWTQDEIHLLRELAVTTPPKLIARHLNRTYEAVRQMASRIEIHFLEERRKARKEIKPNL